MIMGPQLNAGLSLFHTELILYNIINQKSLDCDIVVIEYSIFSERFGH